MHRKLLITGATGFIGGALTALALTRGYAIRVAVRRSKVQFADAIEVVTGLSLDSVTNWDAALQGVSTVIHCAARAHVLNERSPHPSLEYERVNVEATVNLATQAAAAGVQRLIFLSSIGVNGSETSAAAFTAEDPPLPGSAYALSKHRAEVSLRNIARETGLEVVIIRPPLVYGPGAKGNLELLIKWIQSGIPLPLGAVYNRRSLVSIDNLVDLILVCVDHPAASNQTFLVADQETLSTTELLRQIALLLGRPARLVPMPTKLLRVAAKLLRRDDLAEKLLGSLEVDITKTREILSWSPPLSTAAGLRRLSVRQ
jgi:nucleoside-diphosphate-sugar epimerase